MCMAYRDVWTLAKLRVELHEFFSIKAHFASYGTVKRERIINNNGPRKAECFDFQLGKKIRIHNIENGMEN